MKPFVLGLTGLLAATTLYAQVYEWKDESGKTNYSDKPPVGQMRQQRVIIAAPPVGVGNPTQKTTADRELEFRKRQKEAQKNAEKSEKEQVASAEMKENCSIARRQLQTLESGERIELRDDKGERYYLDDAQREQQIVRTRQAVQSLCK